MLIRWAFRCAFSALRAPINSNKYSGDGSGSFSAIPGQRFIPTLFEAAARRILPVKIAFGNVAYKLSHPGAA
jgi:hypothetical protein